MIKRIAGIFFVRAIPAAGVIVLTLLAPMVSAVDRAAVFLTGITLLYLLGIIARFGFDIFLLKTCSARFKDERRVVDLPEMVFFLLSLFLSGLLIIAYLLFSTHFVVVDSYAWVFYALPAFSCQGILSSFLKATGDELCGSMAEPGISSLLASVIFFIFRPLGIDDLALAFACAIWIIFFLTLCYVVSTRSFVASAEVNVRGGMVDSWGFLLNQVSSYASQWYPLFLLGVMDKRLVVYYAVANRMATVISFVGVTIDSFAAPRFSNLWQAGNTAELYAVRRKIARLSLLGALVCVLGVGLVSYAYGQWQSFSAIYSFMSLTLISSYATAIGLGPNSFYLMMTENGYYVTKISVYIFIFVVVFSTFFFLIDVPLMMVVSVGGGVLTRSYFFYRKVEQVDCK